MAADTVAYLRMSRRAFLATGGLVSPPEDWSRHRRTGLATGGLATAELHNEHDAGARWCAAYLLADVWADPEHPGNANAATALETALADEPLPTLRTAYGRALSRKALVG